MAKTVDYTDDENLRDADGAVARCSRALDALPVPVIGRVHGAALGGGAGLAAVCDIVVADEDAVFGFTEVKLGILPAVISPFVAREDRPVGGARAVPDRRALLAPRARRRSAWSTRSCRRRSSTRAVDGYVQRVPDGGAEAIAAAKALHRATSTASRPADVIGAHGRRASPTQRVSPEGQEGLRAFSRSGKPAWTPIR